MWTARFASLLVAVVGSCSEPTADVPEPAPTKLSKAELHLVTLGSHHGRQSPMFDGAVAYLVEHPDESHPLLLERLEGEGFENAFVPEILAVIGRPESVPALERAMLDGSELKTMDAGLALGRHPHRSAFDALVRALGTASRKEALAAAVEGLRRRGDPEACPALVEALDHTSDNARYHGLRAAFELGCIGRERVEEARSDPDDDVRGLAEQLLAGAP